MSFDMDPQERIPPLAPQFSRSVKFLAAWDERNEDPKQNHGVNGVDILFVLRGPEGAVCFRVLTSWMLPEVEEWLRSQNLPRMPGYILEPCTIHSRTPREYWERADTCEFLDAPCWSTHTGFLASDPIWEKMLRKGDEGFWAELERIYALILKPEQP